MWTVLIWFRIGASGGEFFNLLRDCQLFKKGFTALSYVLNLSDGCLQGWCIVKSSRY
jgi:hypothetical protein